jgi:hypothetical protein
MQIQLLLMVSSAVGVVVLGPSRATAQQYECHVVTRGETVALVAKRLTGDVDVRNSSWLRVIDTSRSAVVARREYDRIQPGWQVCIETWLLKTQPESGNTLRRVTAAPDVVADYLWWAVPSALAAILTWLLVRHYRDRTSKTVKYMRHFAAIFIREFERPLMRRGSIERPLRSQVQCLPRSRRLKIYLAPREGRSYPNLSDHRKNVEYDVARVLGSLPAARLVNNDQPYSQGAWVVIPFRFTSGVKEEGGT